ncbi:taste receptor type 2 member 4-like [Pelodytes ibericus]
MYSTSTEGTMLPSSHIFLFAIDFAVLLSAVPGNMFLVLVNLLDWTKNKRLSVTDQLLFGIGIFGLLHGIIRITKQAYILITANDKLTAHINLIFTCVLVPVISCNFWMCTWLGVHFCLKIVKINQRCYIYLQRKFPAIFPFLLLQSVIASCFVSASWVWIDLKEHLPNKTLANSNQSLIENLSPSTIYNPSQAAYSALCSLAFLLHFSSTLTIVTSLFRHMKQIRGNSEGSSSPNIEVHIRAAKTVTSLLFLKILYLVAFKIHVFNESNFVPLYCASAISSLCNILGSLTLIKGNTKLDKKLNEIIRICLCSV